MNAEIILKATNVDGVYDRDPKKDANAVPIKRISYIEVLDRQLKVMDSTAISLSMDNKIPIIVFQLSRREP
jgi:uridylate kinase